MRIAFYSPSWPVERAHNGIATYVGIMKRAFERQGCECVIITTRYLGDDLAAEEGVYVAQTQRRRGLKKIWAKLVALIEGDARYDLGPFSRGIGDALVRAETDKPIDVFECEESFGRPHYFFDYVKTPVIIRMHGPHFVVHQGEHTPFDLKRIEFEGSTIANGKAVTCPSGGVLEKVKSFYKRDLPPARAIANPVEIPPADECWSLENCDQHKLLFVGRFDPIKGADILLDAFSSLAEKHPQIRLVMAGPDSGIPNDAGELEKFEEFFSTRFEPALRERIDFLGAVPTEKLAAMRRDALMCIVSSRFECFPYAVTEALALGCPVVTTPTFGPAEILENGVDLAVCTGANAPAIASEIDRLIADPESAAQMGAAGRRQMIKKFSADEVASQTLEFYKMVIDESGGG